MKYVILNSSEISSVDFKQVVQSSEDTVRYSLGGDKFILKFSKETPSFLIGKDQYNKAEILNILSGPEWSSDEI